MTKIHENEFEINEDLVFALLKSQCSEWANLPLICDRKTIDLSPIMAFGIFN